MTSKLAGALARVVRAGDVITLSGPLGVGKTALARGIIKELGHDGEVPSPTFAIVQPYDDLVPPVLHVDLYRIEEASELEQLGLEDIAEAILLVEWPQRAGEDHWQGALGLSLEFGQHGERILTADVPPSWESRWPPQ